MNLLIASIFIHSGGGPLTGHEVIVVSLVVGIGLLVSICWDTVDGLIKRFYGRNWPTVSAIVDIVSVAYMEDDSLIPAQKASLDNPYYQATLTYIYQSYGEQMGDYSRSFMKKEDAEAWANSYKGETLKVHIDPRDPTRSILREEDL
jgi:hypothetical protein